MTTMMTTKKRCFQALVLTNVKSARTLRKPRKSLLNTSRLNIAKLLMKRSSDHSKKISRKVYERLRKNGKRKEDHQRSKRRHLLRATLQQETEASVFLEEERSF